MSDTAPTLAEQATEIRRELFQRSRVYPRFVAAGKLSQDIADRQTARMTAALKTIEDLIDVEKKKNDLFGVGMR